MQLHFLRDNNWCRAFRFVVLDRETYKRECDACRALVRIARLAGDFAAIVHIVGENQKGGAGQGQSIQVKGLSVLPQRGTRIEVGVKGLSDDLVPVVDAECCDWSVRDGDHCHRCRHGGLTRAAAARAQASAA